MLPVVTPGMEYTKGIIHAIQWPRFSHIWISASLHPRQLIKKALALIQREYNAKVGVVLVVTKPTKEHDAVLPIAPGIFRDSGLRKFMRMALREKIISATDIPKTSRSPLVVDDD
jgi:hypothetical protein